MNRQQRIRQQDAAGAADTRQRRVGLTGAIAQPPLEDAEHARARALGERNEPLGECRPFERLERVKQRQQYHRRQLSEHHDQQDETERRRQPPPLRQRSQQHPDDQRADNAEQEANPGRLELIETPPPRRLRRQFVAPFEHNALIKRERKLNNFGQGTNDDDVADDGEEKRLAAQRRPTRRAAMPTSRTTGERGARRPSAPFRQVKPGAAADGIEQPCLRSPL